MIEYLLICTTAVIMAVIAYVAWKEVQGPAKSRLWLAGRVACIAVLVFICVGYGAYRLARARTFQLFGEIIPRVDTQQKVVALTFDDGPFPGATEEFVKMLNDKSVRATFFVNGKPVEQHSTQTALLIKAGHELGNHTYTHKRMSGVSMATVREELEKTDAALRKAGYTGSIHFRSPYSHKLFMLPLYLKQHGRKNIFMDIEPDSDPELRANSDAIAAHVVERAQPGSIILLHGMTNYYRPSRMAVPAIISGLHERGFRFVTVSELLDLKNTS